jgi:hypothetical protein
MYQRTETSLLPVYVQLTEHFWSLGEFAAARDYLVEIERLVDAGDEEAGNAYYRLKVDIVFLDALLDTDAIPAKQCGN